MENSSTSKNKTQWSRDATKSLKDLGYYLRIARQRRKFTIERVSKSLGIGYQTVVRIEKGDPSVSAGAYMSVAWLFGLNEQIAEGVQPDRDAAGKDLEMSRLPKRVRTEKLGAKKSHDF